MIGSLRAQISSMTPLKATVTAGSAGYHFDVVNNEPTRRFGLSPRLGVWRELGGEVRATLSTVIVSVGRVKGFEPKTKATPSDLFALCLGDFFGRGVFQIAQNGNR
jgi:hypothetical protein